MIVRTLREAQSWWQTFRYNFGWSKFTILFDGWVARCAMVVPVVGYLILFNDFVSKHIAFDELAEESRREFLLSAPARLKFIYFGLVVLGLASILYRLRRPFVMKRGRNSDEYVERALSTFVVDDYISVHGSIRHEGHRTPYGDYNAADYDDFLRMVSGDAPRADNFKQQPKSNWTTAKQKYEHLLRSMLIEFYFRNETKRRTSLSVCIALALGGYALLVVPSIDLFAKVVIATF